MKRIKVMMSSYNGEMYIEEQIKSILAQESVSVELFIRDDGSTDRTVAILERILASNLNVHVIFGNNIGASGSFLELLYDEDDDKQFDYYSFSDQDDIWEKDKLKRAVDIMENQEMPALYYSALLTVREDTGAQKLVKNDKEYTFTEALFQSHYPGCTMVINKLGMLFVRSIRKPEITLMHDIYLAQVFLGTNNKIIYDNESRIHYRIHGNNISVKSDNIIGEIRRYISILNKQKGLRLLSICAYRKVMADLLDTQEIQTLETIIKYKQSVRNRCKLIGMIRHTGFGIKTKCLYIFAVIISFL